MPTPHPRSATRIPGCSPARRSTRRAPGPYTLCKSRSRSVAASPVARTYSRVTSFGELGFMIDLLHVRRTRRLVARAGVVLDVELPERSGLAGGVRRPRDHRVIVAFAAAGQGGRGRPRQRVPGAEEDLPRVVGKLDAPPDDWLCTRRVGCWRGSGGIDHLGAERDLLEHAVVAVMKLRRQDGHLRGPAGLPLDRDRGIVLPVA